MITPKRALISLTDKTGIVPFASMLSRLGIELLSTGGTAQVLRDSGLSVTDVSDVTGFPEIMDGRVKTLHPHIHGGILARRGQDDEVMQTHGIKPIDMVIVNLYPFEQQHSIENIDIGGPAMIRAAAKNHAHVIVITDPADYAQVEQQLETHHGIPEHMARKFAAKAFALTARYDKAIHHYLSDDTSSDTLPDTLTLSLNKVQGLRYGENPHQAAAFYSLDTPDGFANMHIWQGKPLSYNNLADANAAIMCVREFSKHPTCVIVKHANPCGVAQGQTLEDAYERAFASDPTSAFGGIIALNQPLDEKTARRIIEQQFVEVIIAPDIDERALPHLAHKPNVRVLTFPFMQATPGLQLQAILGGALVQTPDTGTLTAEQCKVVSTLQPDSQTWLDALFAWRVVKHVKSNAIVYAKDEQTLGIGPGQSSRIMSNLVAIQKAHDVGFDLSGSVMASDAFFPFRDNIDKTAEIGVKAIISPGGSINDQQVIDACNEHGIVMIFTGMRHFKHQ